MEIEKPNVVLVVNDDFKRGLDKGFYPDIDNVKREGGVEFLAEADQKLFKYGVKLAHENQLYIYNPFYDIYLLSSDNEVEKIPVAKFLKIELILTSMGAKRITLKLMESRDEKRFFKSDNSIEYKVVSGTGNVERTKQSIEERTRDSVLELSCHQPDSIEKINNDIKKYNLSREDDIMHLFHIFKEGKLKGATRKIETTMTSELNSSLDIAFKLDACNVFKLDSKTKTTTETKQVLKYRLEVEFW